MVAVPCLAWGILLAVCVSSISGVAKTSVSGIAKSAIVSLGVSRPLAVAITSVSGVAKTSIAGIAESAIVSLRVCRPLTQGGGLGSKVVGIRGNLGWGQGRGDCAVPVAYQRAGCAPADWPLGLN